MMSIIEVTNEKVFRMINNPSARYDLVVSVGNDPSVCIVRIIYNGDEIYLSHMNNETVRMVMNKMHKGELTILRYNGECEIWTDEINICNAMAHIQDFVRRVDAIHNMNRQAIESQKTVQEAPVKEAEPKENPGVTLEVSD